MTLDLPSEIAQGLEILASAQGLSVEDYLHQLVATELHTVAGAPPMSPRALNPDEWEHQFEQWADSFPDAPLIPDEALDRANLYPDR